MQNTPHTERPLQLYITSFQRTMLDLEVPGCQVVALNSEADDYGLYSTRMRNTFGTPLLARGTLAQLCDLMANA